MEVLKSFCYWLKHSNKERINSRDLLRFTEENNTAPSRRAGAFIRDYCIECSNKLKKERRERHRVERGESCL